MASLSDRKTQIIVAVITGLFVLTGTVLTLVFKSDGKKSYSGRVMEKGSEANIRGAKVSLESQGVPTSDVTGNDGVYSLSLLGNPESVKIRVEKEGYQPFDERVAVADDQFKPIYLTPKPPAPTPTPMPTSTPASTPTPRRGSIGNSKAANSNLLDKRLEGERKLNNDNGH